MQAAASIQSIIKCDAVNGLCKCSDAVNNKRCPNFQDITRVDCTANSTISKIYITFAVINGGTCSVGNANIKRVGACSNGCEQIKCCNSQVISSTDRQARTTRRRTCIQW